MIEDTCWVWHLRIRKHTPPLSIEVGQPYFTRQFMETTYVPPSSEAVSVDAQFGRKGLAVAIIKGEAISYAIGVLAMVLLLALLFLNTTPLLLLVFAVLLLLGGVIASLVISFRLVYNAAPADRRSRTAWGVVWSALLASCITVPAGQAIDSYVVATAMTALVDLAFEFLVVFALAGQLRSKSG